MPGSMGPHSLAFRVMRLCKPSFQVDTPLLFDPLDLLVGEDILDDSSAVSDLPRLLQHHPLTSNDPDPTFRSRVLLRDPSDALGLSDLLVLPQSFGAIYLGETFCSYISINNSSNFEVRSVVIKAEIQTERQSMLLLDTSKSPVESIRSGGRYDFIVEHDVKELGAHTLVCTAAYSDGEGERKHLPQFFKFIVSNPLTVRTKVRVVKDVTFLETSIENNTKSILFMDQVEFQASQQWTVTPLKADEPHLQGSSLTREIFKAPNLIKSGGIRNFLFLLRSTMDNQMKIEGSNVLGKLQITWRANLGEPGRLQTQQILGNPITHKEIELNVVDVPPMIMLGKPFMAGFIVVNGTDQKVGPLEVRVDNGDVGGQKAVYVNGLQSLDLLEIEANGSSSFELNLIASMPGIQKIKGVTVFDTREKKAYESNDYEIFVHSD